MDDLELDELYDEALHNPDAQEATQIAKAVGNDSDTLNALIEMAGLARWDDAECDDRVKKVRDDVRLQSFHKLMSALDEYIIREN